MIFSFVVQLQKTNDNRTNLSINKLNFINKINDNMTLSTLLRKLAKLLRKLSKDSFLIILFLIIWIVRPISYQEVVNRHPISPQENRMLLNSTKKHENHELEFLQNANNDIVLAKSTGGVDAFPLNRDFSTCRPRYPIKQGPPVQRGGRGAPAQYPIRIAPTVTGAAGQPGGPPGGPGGGGGGRPDIGPKIGDSGLNLNNKKAVLGSEYYESKFKSEEQRDLEKRQRELKQALEEEAKINAERDRKGKGRVTLIIKNGVRLFVENDQLRDKFHHAPDLNTKLPKTLSYAELNRLSQGHLHKERIETFRDRDILPEENVVGFGKDLRRHVSHPATILIEGTFGENSDKAGKFKKIEGYHYYNPETGCDAFFDKFPNKYGNKFRTLFTLTDIQENELTQTHNLL